MTDLVDDSAADGSLRPKLQAVREAAHRWEAAALDAELRQQWARAERARLHWASYLHRLGRCDDAVAVLRQMFGRAPSGRGDGWAVAAILCIRLLDRCGRQEEAGEVWAVMEAGTTSTVRRLALGELLSPKNSELNAGRVCRHAVVCSYHRRDEASRHHDWPAGR